MTLRFRYWFEKNGFAVCTRLADRLGMKVKSVRLFFIYASFATLVGGFVLSTAFWMKLKDLIYTKRTSVRFTGHPNKNAICYWRFILDIRRL